jgi:RimJ/RimL family protein N-acetyltransferase
MVPQEFLEFHRPAFERDEVRYNLILGLFDRMLDSPPPELRLWTLGAPGQCAMQTSPRNAIILGDLTAAQCRSFADDTLGLDYPGVVGIDQTPGWFVERAVERGLKFPESVPQQIYALRDKPFYPDAGGAARLVEASDIELFETWMTAFIKEAVPHDALPSREGLEKTIAQRRYQFWTVDGQPVAMAGIVRRTRHAAAIAGVYTPPELRRRGYGGSATAAVAEAVFAEGRTAACLYADLRNPASNRCYAKIGFVPLCKAWHYHRQ